MASYNRPLEPRRRAHRAVLQREYPLVRWLERNGYDVSYFAGVDSDRRGERIRKHKVFISAGHDAYWSAAQRAHIEAARDAGVHLAFMGGGVSFWRARYEPSIDGTKTPYRTLVSYKESLADGKLDPVKEEWTGTWRDSRVFNPQRAARKRADGDHRDRRRFTQRPPERPGRVFARCRSGATPTSPRWRRATWRFSAAAFWATNGTRISTTARGPPA